MSARQPTAAAMAAMTLDHLSGGRVILGIGVSGPAGGRGLVRDAVREAARAHARVRGDHARRLGARGPGDRRRPALPAADARRHRARQAAEVVDPPAARGDPDLPRRRGPEEHRPRRRDLRRLDGDAALALPPGALRRGARRGLRPRGRPPHRRGLRGRGDGADAGHPTTSRPPPTRCATTTPSTSAAWAPRARTSTPTCRSGWATATWSRPVQDLYLAGKKQEAAEAIPFELIDKMSLIGPPGQDPPRPRGLARVVRDHAADRRRRGDRADRRRARARLVCARDAGTR